MAVVSGTIVDVFNISTPLGPKLTTAGLGVQSCFITVTFSGTYAQADNAQVLAITTAISSKLHNGGKTIALVPGSVGMAAPGDEAGTAIGAKTIAVSGTGITCELTDGDLSTEHAGAALGAMGHGICFHVMYTYTPVS